MSFIQRRRSLAMFEQFPPHARPNQTGEVTQERVIASTATKANGVRTRNALTGA